MTVRVCQPQSVLQSLAKFEHDAWGAGRGVEGHIGLSVCDISTKSIAYDSLPPLSDKYKYLYVMLC